MATIDGEFTVRHAITAAVATWPRRVLLGVVIVVPLLLGLAGGYAPAPQRDLPPIQPDQTVQIGPFDLALHEFFVSDEVNVRALPEEADAWLGVVFTATGTHTAAVPFHQYALTFPEELGLINEVSQVNPPHREMLRLDDGTGYYRIEPGLQARVVSLFPITDAHDIADTLTLAVTDLESSWSFLLETESWYERERVGHVTLPRTRVPEHLVEVADE